MIGHWRRTSDVFPAAEEKVGTGWLAGSSRVQLISSMYKEKTGEEDEEEEEDGRKRKSSGGCKETRDTVCEESLGNRCSRSHATLNHTAPHCRMKTLSLFLLSLTCSLPVTVSPRSAHSDPAESRLHLPRPCPLSFPSSLHLFPPFLLILSFIAPSQHPRALLTQSQLSSVPSHPSTDIRTETRI